MKPPEDKSLRKRLRFQQSYYSTYFKFVKRFLKKLFLQKGRPYSDTLAKLANAGPASSFLRIEQLVLSADFTLCFS
ncbi:hypothetical protein A0O21_09150 [Streptococcus pantholopis]|uniref:Uncharacterized protein n=1 Tax=Streptococcus pantholopis TaxID=1811193 RepID=A0A172Q9T1_9STRE|nr:hypothetical protein A0O21_09150 [Streptococcus pantholopis]